jgi:DNA-binding IclR family transcriptional regulator
VGRAISILELLAEGDGELGVSELGRRLGVHKATASRLVSTLAERGLVQRNPVSDKYRLGFGLVHLAGAVMAGLDLVQQARPVLEDLARETGETVNLAVLDGDAVMHIDQTTGSRSIVTANWVGRRTPLHCTSNGKVLLAHLRPDEQDRLLARPLERLTSNTIVDPEAMRAELRQALARGYARAVGELEEGLNAVAAPVRRADGVVEAAVSVSGPSFRMPPRDLHRIAQLSAGAAADISRRIGFTERRQSVGR